MLEVALLEEQRVLVDHDRARILGAVDAMADPGRIERALAGTGITRGLPGAGQRRALVSHRLRRWATESASSVSPSEAVSAARVETVDPVMARSQAKPRIG